MGSPSSNAGGGVLVAERILPEGRIPANRELDPSQPPEHRSHTDGKMRWECRFSMGCWEATRQCLGPGRRGTTPDHQFSPPKAC